MNQLAVKRTVVVAVLALGLATAAHAQDPGTQSHWGVVVGVVPAWKASPTFKIVFDAKEMDIAGTDFRIGAAHGSDLGGNTQIVYLRKTLKEGSTITRSQGMACFASSCATTGTSYVARSVVIEGLEVDKFVSFGTIKRRVQIGLTAGGGVARVKGAADKIVLTATPTFDARGSSGFTQSRETQSAEGKALFIGGTGIVPLGRFDLSVGVIAAPGLKVIAGGGFDFPGYSKFRIDVVYLIGRQ